MIRPALQMMVVILRWSRLKTIVFMCNFGVLVEHVRHLLQRCSLVLKIY